jgi:hypothetical protein
MNAQEWRLAIVKMNVALGKQGRADADAVEARGFVTRPDVHDQCDSRCLVCYPPPVRRAPGRRGSIAQ